MYEFLVKVRNTVIGFLYVHILKCIFFCIDPEVVHDHMIATGVRLGSHGWTRGLVRTAFHYHHPMLAQTIHGIRFENPIGLSAGFDKNARLTAILPSVGFGYAEVGSITGEPCAGNPGRHLWRLPKDKSLVVYYGLKNDGAEIIADRLRNEKFRIPIGISVAKTNASFTVDPEKGVEDYAKAFELFADIGAYTTINISCPNAYGGQPFSDPMLLDQLLTRTDLISTRKPTFIKLSPDLTHDEVDAILEVSGRHRIDGFICTNLIKDRSLVDAKEQLPEKGGMSGKLIESRSNELIAHVYSTTKGKKIIIGCGGIFTAEDAYRKIRLGASLLQMITGMIYEGPQVISQINQDLVRLLKRDGFASISDAIGVDNFLSYTEGLKSGIISEDVFNRELTLCKKLSTEKGGGCGWGKCENCGVVALLYKLHKGVLLEGEKLKEEKKKILQ